jgi:hypothetical protein
MYDLYRKNKNEYIFLKTHYSIGKITGFSTAPFINHVFKKINYKPGALNFRSDKQHFQSGGCENTINNDNIKTNDSCGGHSY